MNIKYIFNKSFSDGFKAGYDEAMHKQKKGRWIMDSELDPLEVYETRYYICSSCGKWSSFGKTDYCPNCGSYNKD